MARPPGVVSHDPFSPSLPPRTPGTLGLNDAADPNAWAEGGDTPGTTGINDGAANVATGDGPDIATQKPPELTIPDNMPLLGQWLIMGESWYMRLLNSWKNPAIRVSALLASVALKKLAAFAQDPEGWELFSAWVDGKIPKKGNNPGELILNNEQWTSYMRAAPGLTDQIHKALTKYAKEICENLAKKDSTAAKGPFETCFHAEVAGVAGGFRTGYELLHGTNKPAGDLGITGNYQARIVPERSMPPSPSRCYDVAFEDLEFVWNDVVDHNKRYATDMVFNDYFRMLSVIGYGVPMPEDYVLRIIWEPDDAVFVTTVYV